MYIGLSDFYLYDFSLRSGLWMMTVVMLHYSQSSDVITEISSALDSAFVAPCNVYNSVPRDSVWG